MNNKHEMEWQRSIVNLCAKRLQRNLRSEEEAFITSQVGFMALEAIEDAAKTLSIEALEEMLNSNTNE